jgi:eukaryotic-like serine/threonine-protein kinase
LPLSKEHRQFEETLAGPVESLSPRPGASGFDNTSIIAGKYRIERRIAEGGNGIVVEAMHLALRQAVAIKYLKPGPRASASVVDRFEREGRLAAQLTSEHVVRVHDVGELDDGSPFMVMELLRGRNLSTVLEESGPLPIPRAVDYVLQTCDALAQVHALAIVHRDIKPDNLILADRPSNTPIVKVIDFGISKSAPERDQSGLWARETSKNDRLGTPVYMSPEQLRSSTEVDARTDIWSIGVTLHELLTKALPFEGEDLPQLCTNILLSPPVQLRAVRRSAPPELEAIILKCLEKLPADRFRNVGELAQALAPFGPPGAQERAERIKDALRLSGISIRPPTPQPGSLDVVAIRDLLAGSLEAPSLEPTASVEPHPRRRRFAVYLVGALGIGALAVVLSLRREGPSRQPAVVVQPTVAVPTETLRAAALAPSPSAVAATPASAAVVTPVALVSPPNGVTFPAKRVATATAHPAGASPIASPKTTLPKPAPAAAPASDPRALFGERK